MKMIDPYKFFVSGIRSPYTRRQYEFWLGRFFAFINKPPLEGQTLQEKCAAFVQRSSGRRGGKAHKERGGGWAEKCIVDYLDFLRQRVDKKEIAGSSMRAYIIAVKLFCDANNVNQIQWKWLMGGVPKGIRSADDRAPTREEMQKIMEYPDRRIPTIVTIACSSGIRLGAWQYLKWGHIEPIFQRQNEDGDGISGGGGGGGGKDTAKLVAAKLRVYVGEPEKYTTFITPEAYHAVEKWMDFRKSCGEKITKESWVLRNLWKTLRRSGPVTDIDKPQRLARGGLRSLISSAEWAQGVRTRLPPGVRRHEFKEDHGFRKFFRTRAEQAGMRLTIARMLMGQSLGIDDSYLKPTEEQMLEDYLKAVPSLTIGDTITEDRAQVIAKAAAMRATAVAERKLEAERQAYYKEFDRLSKEQEKLRKMFDAFIKTGQVRPHPVDEEEVAQSGYYHQSEKR